MGGRGACVAPSIARGGSSAGGRRQLRKDALRASSAHDFRSASRRWIAPTRRKEKSAAMVGAAKVRGFGTRAKGPSQEARACARGWVTPRNRTKGCTKRQWKRGGNQDHRRRCRGTPPGNSWGASAWRRQQTRKRACARNCRVNRRNKKCHVEATSREALVDCTEAAREATEIAGGDARARRPVGTKSRA